MNAQTTPTQVTDSRGDTITVGTWVRTAGTRRVEWAPVEGITPEGRVIVHFTNDDPMDTFGSRADCLIAATGDVAWTPPKTLDTVTRHVGHELCGWCDETAAFTVTIGGMSHADNACTAHFAEYYPHLNNAQHASALCPNVDRGCSHTMAQNDQGYGVACAEYADAHGIAWRQTN
jgi:hypothetical protein